MRKPTKTIEVPAAPLLRFADVARVLNVSIRKVQAMRAAGQLRVVVLSGRCLRVEPAELDRLIREARA